MFFTTKILPACIFTVGCTALAFQATVLHPFHDKLDEEFKEIKELEMQEVKMEVFEAEAMDAVNHVSDQMDELFKLKAQNLIHGVYHQHHWLFNLRI